MTRVGAVDGKSMEYTDGSGHVVKGSSLDLDKLRILLTSSGSRATAVQWTSALNGLESARDPCGGNVWRRAPLGFVPPTANYSLPLLTATAHYRYWAKVLCLVRLYAAAGNGRAKTTNELKYNRP